MICGEIGRQVRLHAVLASTRDGGFVKLSRIASAADGCAWRSAFEGAAMAELLDSKEDEAY
jgi:hypothetical protein